MPNRSFEDADHAGISWWGRTDSGIKISLFWDARNIPLSVKISSNRNFWLQFKGLTQFCSRYLKTFHKELVQKENQAHAFSMYVSELLGEELAIIALKKYAQCKIFWQLIF